MADLDKNDLKTIEGIGPAMETKFKDLGIHTVDDLAARTDPDDISALLETKGVTGDRVRKWIEAATTPAEDVPPADVVAAARIVTADAAVLVTAPINPAAKPAPVTDMSLHQLNLQARSIDRQHKALRDEAIVAADAAATKALQGIAKLNRPRRLQKNLRPLVR